MEENKLESSGEKQRDNHITEALSQAGETENDANKGEDTKIHQSEDTSIMSWLWGLLPLTSLAIACVALVFSMNLNKKSETIRVVDLAGISKFYQDQARQQGLQDGLSDAQRGEILQNLQAKMHTLQQVINEYVDSCNCNVYVKSAIVGRSESVEDVTQQIVNRVNQKVRSTSAIAAPIPAPTNPGMASLVNLPPVPSKQ